MASRKKHLTRGVTQHIVFSLRDIMSMNEWNKKKSTMDNLENIKNQSFQWNENSTIKTITNFKKKIFGLFESVSYPGR